MERRHRGTVALLLALVTVTACGDDARTGDGSGSSNSEGGGEAVEVGGANAAPLGVHGRAPGASGGIPTMVMLTPVEGSTDSAPVGHPAAPARGSDAVVDQFGLAFSPRVLVVAAGEPVRFTNSEGAIAHNVHLRSVDADSSVFNGDTGPSESIEVVLPGPGGYDVLCDMHPGMTGFVFVTEAPYTTAAEADGTFAFGPVPTGPYQLQVWTVDDGWAPERSVTVTADPAPLDLTAR